MDNRSHITKPTAEKCLSALLPFGRFAPFALPLRVSLDYVGRKRPAKVYNGRFRALPCQPHPRSQKTAPVPVSGRSGGIRELLSQELATVATERLSKTGLSRWRWPLVQCQGLATVPPVGFVEGLNAKRKGLQASSQSRAARAPERPQESRNDSGQGVSLPDTLNTPQRAIQTAFTVRRPGAG